MPRVLALGLRINKVMVASWWHRGAWLHWDLSTKKKTNKKKHCHLKLALEHAMLRPVCPTLLNLEDTSWAFLPSDPLWFFLSALDNTQHSCRSTSSKASQNTKIPFHFPPKSYLTVWGSTFKNTRINSDLTQARTTQTIKRFAITTNVLIRPTWCLTRAVQFGFTFRKRAI